MSDFRKQDCLVAKKELEYFHKVLAPRLGCEELFDIYQVCRALRSTPG